MKRTWIFITIALAAVLAGCCNLGPQKKCPRSEHSMASYMTAMGDETTTSGVTEQCQRIADEVTD